MGVRAVDTMTASLMMVSNGGLQVCLRDDMQKIVYAASPFICQVKLRFITIILPLYAYVSQD